MEYYRARALVLVSVIAIFTWVQSGFSTYAQDFPSQPIDWMIAFGPGGGADRTARSMFPAGAEHMGVRVNLRNVPGAGGVVAWKEMLGAEPDGYTLLQGTSTPVLSLLLESNPPLQPDQIKIVCYLSSFSTIVSAKKGKPWENWEGLVAYAKANPGKLTLGGTNSNLIGAVNVLTAAGLEVTLVPYSSTTDTVADFIGNHIDLIAAEPPATIDLVKQDSVAIYNSGSDPLPDDVNSAMGSPPLATKDLGLAGFSFPRWIGVHPDTDDAKVKILSDRIGAVLKDEQVVKRLKGQNLDIGFSPYDQAQSKYDEMVKSMREAVKLIK